MPKFSRLEIFLKLAYIGRSLVPYGLVIGYLYTARFINNKAIYLLNPLLTLL